VRRGDRLRVGGERTLVLDQAHELFGQIDVGAFERTGRDRATAAAAGGAEGDAAAVARLDPEVLTGAAGAVVRAELRDRELAESELLAVGVEARHDALAVDRDAREVTGGVAVLRLARDVRGRRELRDAVEARAAGARDRRAEVERDDLTGGRAGEVHG